MPMRQEQNIVISFYIIRHEETLLNCLNRAQDWSNSPLTGKGGNHGICILSVEIPKRGREVKRFFCDKRVVMGKLFSYTNNAQMLKFLFSYGRFLW